MNAKITVTVPIEDLHITVSDMIEAAASKTEILSVDLTSISKEVAKQENILKQMENLDKARKLLTLLDANLEDCYSILNGLVKYKTEQPIGQNNADQPTK